ncbi:MAG TPA: AAA family ATPase [Acetobacteraceae bacterium]|nr:AAA family ATPase [Acetobacteraceae bacterium]
MAIQFARARYISRSTGGSAVRSAAYNERTAITAERTGELYYFRHRDAPAHHEVLLPEGADARFSDSAVLWNAAEAAEKRKDAQVAREIVLALPSDAGITTEDRIELARSFAAQHFVAKGLAVQLDVHAPHDPEPGRQGDSDSERANWHAHLLITTRRIEGTQFAAKKARDLDPEVRRAGGRAVVADGEAWGELWRDHQNRYFVEHGLGIRVDPAATHAQQHIGPVRMRRAGAEIVERAETIRQANEAAARDPEQVLATLTRHNATFSERDLDRHLGKHIADDGERAATKAAVLGHAETLPLYDRASGEAAGRYTTKTVRAQERAALTDAKAVAGARHHRALPAAAIDAAVASRSLRPDQRKAFDHAVAAGGLKIIEGRAGTGKSYSLTAIRDAHALVGRRVIGLAPTNAVAQDLKAEGFTEAATAHSELFRLKNGRTSWDRRTVVVVDEAAMLESRVTGELLAEARRTGAKVILAGDDRQLASIERGGLFSELRQRHGSAQISEITRQRTDWQRQAARDLAEGRFAEAVAAFDRAGAITWTQDQVDARVALVAAWRCDTAAEPDATRFVFAYTNRDVDALNAELRQVRRDRGELLGPDVRFETKHGPAAFAPGDRVQFTDTLKAARIYNGNVGTITDIDARTGVIRARMDSTTAGQGREVVWSASEFIGFRHGYAGTIYKGQGKTLDHTYLYHTHHWRSAASYVALTRQRESAQVFVARETARDASQLARQMAREEIKAASVAWATRDELTPAMRERAPRDKQMELAANRQAEAAARHRAEAGYGPGVAPRLPAAAAPPQPGKEERAAPEILIPGYVDPSGRDSLGRGLDPGSIAAVVAADRTVRREREALSYYLLGAYRDPQAAKAQLDEMVKRQGWTSTAARIAQDPTQLGQLLGRTGLFASGRAKSQRALAEDVAGAIAPDLERIGAAEARAALTYRASVEAQRKADAIPIPRLSARAEAAVATLTAAPDDRTRATLWRGVTADPSLGPELQRFSDAVRQRFGEETVRAMLRSEGALAEAPSVAREHQAALTAASRTVHTLKQGEYADAHEVMLERLAQRRELGLWRGISR